MTSEIAPQVNTNNNYVVIEGKCPLLAAPDLLGGVGGPRVLPRGELRQGLPPQGRCSGVQVTGTICGKAKG